MALLLALGRSLDGLKTLDKQVMKRRGQAEGEWVWVCGMQGGVWVDTKGPHLRLLCADRLSRLPASPSTSAYTIAYTTHATTQLGVRMICVGNLSFFKLERPSSNASSGWRGDVLEGTCALRVRRRSILMVSSCDRRVSRSPVSVTCQHKHSHTYT